MIPYLRMTAIGLLLALLAVATPAQSPLGQQPRPGPGDRRIRTLVYQPDTVFALITHFYIATAIHFGEDESLLPRPIIGGDPLAWDIQIIAANAISVKPIAESPATNMTIYTDRHVYYFELDVARKHDRTDATYGIHFVYPFAAARRARQGAANPDPAPDARLVKQQEALINNSVPLADLYSDYRISGARDIRPVSVFDDGLFTYFRFAPGARTPAIYARDADGLKNVNHHSKRDYLIVQRLADRFELRLGRHKAQVRRVMPIARKARPLPAPGLALRPDASERPVGTSTGFPILPRQRPKPAPAAPETIPAQAGTPAATGTVTVPRPATVLRPPPDDPARHIGILPTERFIEYTGQAPAIPCAGGYWERSHRPANPDRLHFLLRCPEAGVDE